MQSIAIERAEAYLIASVGCARNRSGRAHRVASSFRAAVRYGQSLHTRAATAVQAHGCEALNHVRRAVRRQAAASEPLARLGARGAGEYLRRCAEVGRRSNGRERNAPGSVRPRHRSAVPEVHGRAYQTLAHRNLHRRPCAFGWRSRTLEAMNTKVSRSLSSTACTPNQWPNPSIEGTHNGGAQWRAPSRSAAPLCAPHVKRWTSFEYPQFPAKGCSAGSVSRRQPVPIKGR